MHREYLDAGADVVETNSFGGMRATLAEYGLGERTEELNEMAARIARDVADEFSTPERPRFVAGSIGPGTRFASLGHVGYEELRDQVAEQARGLLRGGVDLLLLETQFDLLGIKAGMNGCRDAMADVGREVPIQTQVTIELTGRMLPGTEIGAALVALDAMRPDVIGINCATGPEEMSEHVRHLSAHSRIPISVLPNAGLPSVVDGHMHYDLSAEQFVDFHRRFITEFGVNVVGGCCGTTPEYIRQLADAVAEIEPAHRHPHFEHGVASIYSPVAARGGRRRRRRRTCIMIGERTNANGSKKFREAMLDGDWDTCVAMAKDQVKEGSHIIDVCVDYVGRDGTADMDEIAQRFATQSSVPLVLDSTEPEVLEAGLRWLGGRAILNSANLEDGDAEGSRIDRVFNLAKEYGAAVIVLLIDEEGQARDVEWKMRVAHRIHDLAIERYGLEPQDLIFDALTFPLSTGDDDLRRDAIATIEAIRRIKAELPGRHHHAGAVQRQLRPEAGGAPRAQQRVPGRVRQGRARLRHRARGQDPAAQPHPRRAARRLHGPDLGPPGHRGGAVGRRRELRPAPQAARDLRGRPGRRGRSSRTAPTGRSSSASASASSTATATAWSPTSRSPSPTATPRWRSSTTSCWPA